jgi:hypothetical protein
VAAAARQPGGTLMLRSDRLTPAELADEVLARADAYQTSSNCDSDFAVEATIDDSGLRG